MNKFCLLFCCSFFLFASCGNNAVKKSPSFNDKKPDENISTPRVNSDIQPLNNGASDKELTNLTVGEKITFDLFCDTHTCKIITKNEAGKKKEILLQVAVDLDSSAAVAENVFTVDNNKTVFMAAYAGIFGKEHSVYVVGFLADSKTKVPAPNSATIVFAVVFNTKTGPILKTVADVKKDEYVNDIKRDYFLEWHNK
ncbi:MAG: hypothetical protein LBD17_00320 [Endomicrobium sp.]|jgi:hypothetical protein|nr:hypothetical protein [Endomicrobium sp.]